MDADDDVDYGEAPAYFNGDMIIDLDQVPEDSNFYELLHDPANKNYLLPPSRPYPGLNTVGKFIHGLSTENYVREGVYFLTDEDRDEILRDEELDFRFPLDPTRPEIWIERRSWKPVIGLHRNAYSNIYVNNMDSPDPDGDLRYAEFFIQHKELNFTSFHTIRYGTKTLMKFCSINNRHWSEVDEDLFLLETIKWVKDRGVPFWDKRWGITNASIPFDVNHLYAEEFQQFFPGLREYLQAIVVNNKPRVHSEWENYWNSDVGLRPPVGKEMQATACGVHAIYPGDDSMYQPVYISEEEWIQCFEDHNIKHENLGPKSWKKRMVDADKAYRASSRFAEAQKWRAKNKKFYERGELDRPVPIAPYVNINEEDLASGSTWDLGTSTGSAGFGTLTSGPQRGAGR